MEQALDIFKQGEWVVTLLFTAVMTSFLAYIIINSKHTRVMVYYCLGHSLTILLITASFAAELAVEERTKWIITAGVYLFKLVFDVIFILYINAFYKPARRYFHLAAIIVYVIAGVTTILTNPLHGLFIKSFSPDGAVFGALYYVFLGCGFALEVIGMLCIIKYWVKKLDNRGFRVIASMIAISGMAFLHLSLMNAFKLKVDCFPLLIALIFAFYFVGASKYGMFDAISYNSVYGLELFTDALLITTGKGTVTYRNKACEQIDEKTLHEIRESFGCEVKRGEYSQGEIKRELELAQEDGIRFYTVTVKPVKRRAFSVKKQIYIIHDNTKEISAINQLCEKNQYLQEMNDSTKSMAEDAKRLAVLSERNLLANEIHDVVGHALILALNTMESNKLLRDRSLAMRRLRQVVTEIGVILREMESARYRDRSETASGGKASRMLLSERLSALETRLSEAGIDLEISSSGDLDGCKRGVANDIYRICQESVTNAIKHGKAGKIAISIKNRSGLIELYILDNGKGCAKIEKGTGLSSMESRVQKLGGTINFSSFEGQEGFMVRAGIPM